MAQPDNQPDVEPMPKTPAWVKVFGIIFLALVLLFGILHLTGNSFGPGMHTAPSQHGVQQP